VSPADTNASPPTLYSHLVSTVTFHSIDSHLTFDSTTAPHCQKRCEGICASLQNDIDEMLLTASMEASRNTSNAKSKTPIEQMGAGDPHGCPMLSMPLEICNVIYDLVFEREDGDTDGLIELTCAQPTSMELLLVCRQIYPLAQSFYKTSYRSYWSTSTFMVDSARVEKASSFQEVLETVTRDTEAITMCN